MANILGINLSELDEAAALKKAEDFLNSPRAHYIVTPNPEIILRAHQDEEFFYILNNKFNQFRKHNQCVLFLIGTYLYKYHCQPVVYL